MDKFGIPHFLEANLLPSLIDGYGSFPLACKLNAMLEYEAMILAIVRLAFDRSTDDFDEVIKIQNPLRIPLLLPEFSA
jgi:hypothetical protein